MKARLNLYLSTKCNCQIALLTGFLLLLPLILNGAQDRPGGLRIITPQDGVTVEPGQRFAVAVEPDRGVTPAFVAIISRPIAALQQKPPFSFSVSYPSDVSLGPKRLIADGLDTRDRPLSAEITLHVETKTPATSIRVTPSDILLGRAHDDRLSVRASFADGQTRYVTESREMVYVSSNPQIATVTSVGLVEAMDNGATTVTATYKGRSVTVPVKVEFKKLTVSIKIRPESPRNEVNLTSKGRLPVAIFSTRDFDATRVRPETVRFGPNRAKPVPERGDDRDDERDDPERDEREEKERIRGKVGHIEDINGDRLPDLLLHFRIPQIGLTCADTQATLTGSTLLGERISGTASVLPTGPGCR